MSSAEILRRGITDKLPIVTYNTDAVKIKNTANSSASLPIVENKPVIVTNIRKNTEINVTQQKRKKIK
jgi:uncharacterized protein YfaS (alpha-2-macroglobulin family)